MKKFDYIGSILLIVVSVIALFTDPGIMSCLFGAVGIVWLVHTYANDIGDKPDDWDDWSLWG